MKKGVKAMYTLDKSKKAVSVIVGYVILISFAIVIGVIVYQWMKTYIPEENITCPDGVSIFIESYEYNTDSNLLTLNLKNNGKFDIGGYFIYATDDPRETLATVDISKYNVESYSILKPLGIRLGPVLNPGSRNSLSPNDNEKEIYNLTNLSKTIPTGMIYSVEILPIRWQIEKNRLVTVSCTDAKIREKITPPCVPETMEETCGSAECGTRVNNCGDEVICLPNDCGTDICDTVLGQCVSSVDCTDTCDSLGWVCGIVCGIPCGTCTLDNAVAVCDMGTCIISDCHSGWGDCNNIDSDGCESELGTEEHCSSCTDVCTAGVQICTSITEGCTSCNYVWTGYSEDSSVECDGTPFPAHCLIGCTCEVNYIGNSTGGCSLDTSNVGSCGSYCALFTGYSNGACLQNPNQCSPGTWIGNILGADATFGDSFCNVGNADTCCCYT